MNDYTSLITSEHNQRPKFKAMVGAVAGAWGSVYDFTQTIPAKFDLDTAEGAQLDVIGQWVGQTRLIPNVLLVQYFNFVGNPAALNFGEEGNSSIGGRFYGEGEPVDASTILADPEYRTIIRARIVRNTAKGLTSDFIRSLQFIFNAPAIIDDPADMTVGIFIGRYLSLTELAIITGLDILPRPSGVRIRTRGYYDGTGYLGFEGQVNALPFAEEGYTGPLHQLMEEF